MKETQLIKNIHDQIINYLKDQNKNIGLTKPNVSIENLNEEFDISLDESTNFDGIKEIIEKYLSLAVKTGSTNFYNDEVGKYIFHRRFQLKRGPPREARSESTYFQAKVAGMYIFVSDSRRKVSIVERKWSECL